MNSKRFITYDLLNEGVDPSDIARIRSGEPVAAVHGAGADRRHDPRYLCKSLLHSAGVLVYLQETGGERMIAGQCNRNLLLKNICGKPDA